MTLLKLDRLSSRQLFLFLLLLSAVETTMRLLAQHILKIICLAIVAQISCEITLSSLSVDIFVDTC